MPRSPPRVSSEGVVTMALERIGSSERRLGAPRALERTASRSDGEQEDDKATGARAGLASPAQWKKTQLGSPNAGGRRERAISKSPEMSPVRSPAERGRCICVGVDGSAGSKAAIKWVFSN